MGPSHCSPNLSVIWLRLVQSPRAENMKPGLPGNVSDNPVLSILTIYLWLPGFGFPLTMVPGHLTY